METRISYVTTNYLTIMYIIQPATASPFNKITTTPNQIGHYLYDPVDGVVSLAMDAGKK